MRDRKTIRALSVAERALARALVVPRPPTPAGDHPPEQKGQSAIVDSISPMPMPAGDTPAALRLERRLFAMGVPVMSAPIREALSEAYAEVATAERARCAAHVRRMMVDIVDVATVLAAIENGEPAPELPKIDGDEE